MSDGFQHSAEDTQSAPAAASSSADSSAPVRGSARAGVQASARTEASTRTDFLALAGTIFHAPVPRYNRKKSSASARPSRTRNLAFDGLKALAILAVVLYHTRPSFLEGGFVGVTIFFALAGFFTTRSLTRRRASAGASTTTPARAGTTSPSKVNTNQPSKTSAALTPYPRPTARGYLRFMWSRVKRLYPSVLVTVALTSAFTYAFAPSLLPKAQGDALPSALFAQNWFAIFREQSYFDASGLPSPLTHMWYLAVLMQLYLVFALVIPVLLRTRGRTQTALILGGLALASTLAMGIGYAPLEDVSTIYYGTHTRAAEFLIGAIAALYVPGVRQVAAGSANTRPLTSANTRPSPVAEAALNLIGLAALVVLVVGFVTSRGDSALLYRGGFAVYALATSVLAVVVTNRVLIGEVLGFLAPIGQRSLSIYLVHFPMLTWMNPATRTTDPTWWQWALQFVAVAVVAEVFYRLVERPLRRPRGIKNDDVLAGPAAGLAVNGAAAAAVRTAASAPESQDEANELAPAVLGAVADSPAPASPAASGAPAVRPAVSSAPASNHKLETYWMWLVRAGLVGGAAIATLALVFAPLNWHDVAQARAEALRPELVEQAGPAGQSPDSESSADAPAGESESDGPANNPSGTGAEAGAEGGASSSSQESSPDSSAPTQEAGPVAEKVPANLPWQNWSFDPATGTTDAKVLMVGDSVTLGAQPHINAYMPNAYVDGKVSRQFWHGQEVYAQLEAQGHGGDVTIIALGANGQIHDPSFIQPYIDQAGGRPLYFLTLRSPLPLQDPNNAMLREAAAQHPNVGIIDWHGASEGHPEYIVDDGTHLTSTGQEAFALLIRQALVGK